MLANRRRTIGRKGVKLILHQRDDGSVQLPQSLPSTSIAFPRFLSWTTIVCGNLLHPPLTAEDGRPFEPWIAFCRPDGVSENRPDVHPVTTHECRLYAIVYFVSNQAASAVTSADSSEMSSTVTVGVGPKSIRIASGLKPVPTGINLPRMTFSFNPRS